jgi:flagellar basal-body rod protein FlgB
MDPTRIAVFDLAEKRLAWVERRQALLARNMANVATPSFQPQDLAPFTQTLGRMTNAEPVKTQAQHMSGTQGGALQPARPNRPHGRAPDGNAVALDEQLVKIADTETTQALTTAVYKKYMGLFSLALGRTP